MIPILKKAGVYKDHMDFAGVFHGFFLIENDSQTTLYFKDWKYTIENYL